MVVAALAASLLVSAGPPSEICEVRFVERLVPGSYTGSFFQLGNAKGGPKLANMDVQVQVKGKLVLEVDEDGVVTAAGSPRAQWVLVGVGQLGSGRATVFTGMKGFAEGPLSMAGPGGAEALKLVGDIQGQASAFTQIDKDRVSWPGPAIGELEVELQVSHPFCSQSHGDMSSKTMEQTLAALAAKGFTTDASKGDFSLKGPPQLEDRERDLKKRMDQASQWARGGGEDPRGERAWPLFAAAAESILRERSGITRFCLRMQYERPARAALDARLAAIRGALDAIDSSPRNLGFIRMGIDDLVALDRHVVELKLDTCSEKLHRQIFDTAVAKLEAVTDRAVKERANTGDLSEILRSASVTGKVAPGLRDRAVAQLKARAAAARSGG